MDTVQPTSSLFATCLVLAIALPLLSFVVSFLISERYSWMVSVMAPFFMLLATLAAAVVFGNVWQQPAFLFSCRWFSLAGNTIDVSVWLNNMAAFMLLVVSGISFLVHVYSIGYMAGDADIKRYFAMLGLFTFAMLGVVVSGNLLVIFICWELVGFASYMLIGHWKEKPEAAAAAKRAFIINRVGDAGFLIGLLIVWTHAGTLDLPALQANPGAVSWLTWAALAVFCGVIGKSAQFPLFTWLPDAMEGPTPVSALIHAATMVAAGVFLLARVHFLFTPGALDVVTVVGAITALLGALAALGQYDIKKILAYSTMSQLGLMVVALGAGSPAAALLHLFTHAFFKACLFLCAGAVIHALHQAQHQSHVSFDVQDIRHLGGLRRKMKFTFVVFAISGAALAGIPFTTGFLSKDAIFTQLQQWMGNTLSWRWAIVAAVALVTFITVLYTFRLLWSVFGGREQRTASLQVQDVPAVMRAPMAVLAVASLWFMFSWNPFDFAGWVQRGLTADTVHGGVIAWLSAGWVVTGLLVAYAWRKRSWHAGLLLQGFYMARLYEFLFAKPVVNAGTALRRVDKKWIDGALHTAAYLQLIVAHLTGWFDRAIVDGVVNGAAGLAKGVGSFTRSFQDGKIQVYIFWALLTIIIFIIWTLL